MAAGVDGGFKQGTEKVVKEDTEVLNNVVALVYITVKKKMEGHNENGKFYNLAFLDITIMKLKFFSRLLYYLSSPNASASQPLKSVSAPYFLILLFKSSTNAIPLSSFQYFLPPSCLKMHSSMENPRYT